MTEKELEKLYSDAYKAVYWTAFSILKDQDEAEDVVQETFLTAFERYDSLQDKTKAVAWVKKIAANKSLNIVTRKRTINVDDETLEDTEPIGEDFLPDSYVESAEKRKIIMDIINNSLSQDAAMTIILFYFDEMSIKEIAELLHIPQGTVLSRLNYAKKKIKKEVEKYEKDNDDKLFAMGVPFLTKLFEKEAEQVPFKPMPASLASLAASSKAPATAAASSAAKASAAIIIRNIAIGLITAGVLGGVGYFAYHKLIKPNDVEKETSEEVSEETDDSTSETYETKETKKYINVKGMTPDLLDLSGGYVQIATYHDYVKGTDTLDHHLYYNSDGQLILDCLFNEDDTVIYSDYFVYDKEGRVSREELWDASETPNGLYKDYTYGKNGIERVESGKFEYDPEEYYEYEYDIMGLLTKVTEYKTKSGNVYWFCDYEYDADNAYTTWVTAWDTLSQKMVKKTSYCKYSADGRILEEYEQTFQNTDFYIYDANGVLTSMEHYSGSSLASTVTYNYDSEGRLTSKVNVSVKGDKKWEYTYEYKDL